MPSKSKVQEKLMRAAAHTKGGYGGVSQDVGKEFEAADEKKRTRADKIEAMYHKKKK